MFNFSSRAIAALQDLSISSGLIYNCNALFLCRGLNREV